MNAETNKNDIVFITGVSASGKDFLLEHARDNFSDDVITLSLGALIHANMRRKYAGLYEASDSLKLASLKDLRTSAENALDDVSIKSNDKTIVLNGHIAYRRQESIVVDPDMNIKLNPRDYIFVKSDPDEILSRRKNDKRDRTIEPVGDIYIQQEIAQTAVMAIARMIGSRVYIIHNDDSNIENNVGLISEIVNNK